MVTRSIETAQRKVEAHNFDIRKNLLEYDNVANDQRKAIYELRDELMGAERVTPMIDDIRGDVVTAVVDAYVPPQSPEELWNLEGLEEALKRDFALDLPLRQYLADDKDFDEKALRAKVLEALTQVYEGKKDKIGAMVLEPFEKETMLRQLDQLWREHLASMDYLRMGIHLRGYAQKDPKQEYKREAFTMFNEVLARFKHQVISQLSRIQILTEEEVAALEAARRNEAARPMEFQHADAAGAVEAAAEAPMPVMEAAAPPPRSEPMMMPHTDTFVRDLPKVGRNDPCPCGSGKKYKQCHGQLT
jgi:preprotein translocase subunit SecA